MTVLRPVILCGGSGTRLWPLSRSKYPKQFMDLGGHTLFGDTLDRAMQLPGSSAPLVVCNEEHRFYAAIDLQSRKIQGEVLLEPEGRNTAPAIAMAALAAVENGEDPLLLVLPSDHALSPQQAFADAVEQGCACAAAGDIVTFGITPSRPETGFGYILQGEPRQGTGGYAVTRFVEKPDAAHAEAMLAAGGCFWNSGMFLFRASVYLEELKQHAPAIFAACCEAWACRKADMDFVRPGKEAFLSCPSDSIDYAVMERTSRVAVVPLPAEWSDLGSWEAFYEAAEHDAHGNVCIGDTLVESTEDCYLHGTHRLVAALGVSNLVIVETPDSVLVANRSSVQQVKALVEDLRSRGRTEAELHPLVYRPWGSYEQLALGNRFQVKRLIVNPGAELPLQMHHHRAEHWVVVEGTAEVMVNGHTALHTENESAYIPLGAVHSLKNPGIVPLVVIEIMSGSYLGEDDIVRFDDKYGRNG